MQRITRGTGALMTGVVLLVAGCGRGGTADLPSACNFADGASTVKSALARAPGAVTVDGTPLSKCLGRDADAADVQSVGAAYVDTASDLAARVRANPHGAAAVQLGYLVGAVRRGASKTAGIHYELERRLDQEVNGIDTRSSDFVRGERAGEASG
ncbi:MAG: hypothetical protein ACJ768_21700 [Gaiellaceae bacterium]